MKVILVTHTFFPYSVGGREKHVYDVGKVLSKRGYKVEIFTCSDSLFRYREKRESENLVIRYFPTIHIPMVVGYYRIPLTMLYNLLKTNADIIHVHEYFHFTTFISSIAARIKKIPLVLTEHGYPERIGIQALFLKLYHKICLPQIIFSSKKIIAVSKFIKAEILPKFNLPPEKVNVVYNGIRLTEYTKKSNVFRKKYGLEDSKIILGIGRLIKEKGFQYLIKALPTILEKIPTAKIVIIGPDHYFKKSLMKYSENLEVKNKVIFTGNVPEDMLKSAIYSSDVVVIPSFYEPFG
ncbi:MAG: glycosyltransferase family 4 protein, partial [Candidatus Omnitrophica bacterium]|nr:glycosyltransferase family 4 protein [Candidatus Omnitrophota bacterium]